MAEPTNAEIEKVARIAGLIDWNPTCLPGQHEVTIVRQILESAASLDQLAGSDTRCMNGPAKQHTLRMVAIIKALKAAAVNGQLPATVEPLPFAKIARAIVDHWPRELAEPEMPGG
jgi:hypothetical protein